MFYHNLQDIPLDLEGRVAIKLHMGEKGNKTHVRPEEVRMVFEELKHMGCKPFLVDTTTLYPKARYTREGYFEVAKEHGFGEFPVVIARDEDWVERGGFKYPREIWDADALLVFSHGKGHRITGFGGAVKNLGMGCVVKETKRFIHSPTQPRFDPSRCLGCKACERACFANLIRVSGPGKVEIDYEKCCGCMLCVNACKTGALEPKGTLEESFRLFALAAKGLVKHFEGRIFCITVLKRITEFCDCVEDPGRIVCEDIGFVAGKDPLETDIESVELIREKNSKALNFERWERFRKEVERIWRN